MTAFLASNRNIKTAALAGTLAISMVGLGFAAVPLYKLFCATTGFGGTTMRVDEAQAATVKDTGKAIRSGLMQIIAVICRGNSGPNAPPMWLVLARAIWQSSWQRTSRESRLRERQLSMSCLP